MNRELYELTKAKSASAGEALDKFLKDHHITWWGDPAQPTTYTILKDDVYSKLVAIIDKAIDEHIEGKVVSHRGLEFKPWE